MFSKLDRTGELHHDESRWSIGVFFVFSLVAADAGGHKTRTLFDKKGRDTCSNGHALKLFFAWGLTSHAMRELAESPSHKCSRWTHNAMIFHTWMHTWRNRCHVCSIISVYGRWSPTQEEGRFGFGLDTEAGLWVGLGSERAMQNQSVTGS